MLKKTWRALEKYHHNSSLILFWVQIKNVPIICMDEEIYKEIGGFVGRVEEVDIDRAGDCMGQVIRLRITMNITQPLKKILFIESKDGKNVPFAVEYEKLLDFCYYYGCIGH